MNMNIKIFLETVLNPHNPIPPFSFRLLDKAEKVEVLDNVFYVFALAWTTEKVEDGPFSPIYALTINVQGVYPELGVLRAVPAETGAIKFNYFGWPLDHKWMRKWIRDHTGLYTTGVYGVGKVVEAEKNQ